MGDTRATDAVMTLSDVASLARVKRPVVSTWRRRPDVDGHHIPFPVAVEVRAGQERFAASAVVEWLDRTGRGNNPDARADALAHAQPLVDLSDAAAAAGLEALLCAAAASGIDLADTSPADLLSHASLLDPDDDHLVSELLAAGDELGHLAGYAGALVDAAWDAASAYDLVRRRKVRTRAGVHVVGLSGAARRLVARVGAAVALDQETDVVVTDPLGSDPDLVDAVLSELGEGVAAHILLTDDVARSRAIRRLHVVRRRSVVSETWSSARPLVVTTLPLRGAKADPSTVLTTMDDVQLTLAGQQRALVVGPATLLCDRLADPALEEQRDHLLRFGRLRCALRLPAGLVSDGSRQALGLWVVGATSAAKGPRERRVTTLDLTNETLSDEVIEEVVTDVVASLADVGVSPKEQSVEPHAFRFAQIQTTASLLASSGALVPVGARPRSITVGSSAEHIVRVRRRIADLDAGLGGGPGSPGGSAALLVDPASTQDVPIESTVDAALRSRDLRALPGTRLRDVPTEAAGGVRVIRPEDVRDPMLPRRGIDPLELEERAPRARRTEPGDVVFCVSPRPAAIVDEEGLSVVVAPARVLRCAPGGGLVPEVVARAIADLPDDASRWRAWRLPRVPPAASAGLRAALRHLLDEDRRARERQADLAALARDLTAGVAAGALTVSLTSPSTTDPSTTDSSPTHPRTTQEGP